MADNTDMIREITRLVVQELGDADPQLLKNVVSEVVKAVELRGAPKGGEAPSGVAKALSITDCVRCRTVARDSHSNRAVVTVTGMNRSGIVARVASAVAECHADIQDISQTLVGGFFTMILILDLKGLGEARLTFKDLRERLTAAGRSLGVEVIVVHEDILTGMQRV